MNNNYRTTFVPRLIAASLGVALALAGLAAHAEVYRWVDANGKTQFSDKPPPDQKNVKQLDLKNAAVSPAAKAAAEQRAAADKARAQAPAAPPTAKSDAKGKARDPDEGKSELQKSQECFARYRGPNGRPSPEAGQHCQEVKIPN
ncbi:MAG TPA: DUF4124 domain-containing protein [Burkholderiales bacterium]|jgi:hypothetical protein